MPDTELFDGTAPVTWQPKVGDRVRVVASGRAGTVVHITLTEWGFLYDLEPDEPAEAGAGRDRRTYATGELAPIEPGGA